MQAEEVLKIKITVTFSMLQQCCVMAAVPCACAACCEGVSPPCMVLGVCSVFCDWCLASVMHAVLGVCAVSYNSVSLSCMWLVVVSHSPVYVL